MTLDLGICCFCRAFSTLEGIGLSSDSNYSILKECFPYLAKRLISDDSPRARGALRMLLYGTGDELDLSKLQDITSGLESYTVSTSSVESSRGTSDAGRIAAAEQLASVLLAEEGNYVQSLMLRESAVALDAAVRDMLSPSFAVLRNLPPPPVAPAPLAAMMAPLTLPFELAQAAVQLQSLDASDERKLKNVRILTKLAGGVSNEGRSSASGGAVDTLGLAQAVVSRQTALMRMGVRFGGSLASVQAERLRQRARSDDSGNAPGLSELAGRLAVTGAESFEGVATAMSLLDRDLNDVSLPFAPLLLLPRTLRPGIPQVRGGKEL